MDSVRRMPPIKNNPSMPPMPPRAPAGTQTSDAYGHVISTRPVPAPSLPPAGPKAPTSDAYGHVISVPDGYVESHPLPPGAVTGTNGPNRSVPTSKINFSVHSGMKELQD